MTLFLVGVMAGTFLTTAVIAACMAIADDGIDGLGPGLWVVDIDETGDIAAAEPLDDRRTR